MLDNKNGEWRNYKKCEKWVNCKNLMNVLLVNMKI